MSNFTLKLLYNDHDVYATFPLRPLDLQGWSENFPLYQMLIHDMRPKLIVEVGVWKGSSSVFMANELKNAGRGRIVCVDTWLGAVEFWTKHIAGKGDWTRDLKWQNGYPSVYYTFLSNVVRRNVTEQVIPFPATSAIACDFFKRKWIRADMVHVDASHSYEDVISDLNCWSGVIRKGGVLFGDDYSQWWPDVKRAVDEFVGGDKRRRLTFNKNKWMVRM